MSKRQRKHNHVVSSVLAAALAFTAIVSSVQLASVSDDLAANVGGRYVASHVTPESCVDPQVYDAASDSCVAGGTPPPAGGDGGGGGTISCNSLNGQPVTPAICDDADSRRNACVSPSTWDGSGSGVCNTAPAGGGTPAGGGAGTYVTQPTCQSAGYFWYNNVCNSTAQVGGGGGGTASSYVTQPTCQSAGYFWYNNVCNSTAQVGGGTPAGGGASSYVTQPTCTGAAYFWSTIRNMCYSTQLEKTNAEGAPAGGDPNSYVTEPACVSANFYWYNNRCNSTGAGTSSYPYPAGTCPNGTSYPAGNGAPPCGTSPTPTVGSCTNGQYWDAATSTCKTSTQGTMNCPQGQYYNGTSCVTSPTDMPMQPYGAATACGYNQYWNGTACVQSPAPQPYTGQAATGTFFCFSLNRMATAVECGEADKAAGVGPTMPVDFRNHDFNAAYKDAGQNFNFNYNDAFNEFQFNYENSDTTKQYGEMDLKRFANEGQVAKREVDEMKKELDRVVKRTAGATSCPAIAKAQAAITSLGSAVSVMASATADTASQAGSVQEQLYGSGSGDGGLMSKARQAVGMANMCEGFSFMQKDIQREVKQWTREVKRVSDPEVKAQAEAIIAKMSALDPASLADWSCMDNPPDASSGFGGPGGGGFGGPGGGFGGPGGGFGGPANFCDPMAPVFEAMEDLRWELQDIMMSQRSAMEQQGVCGNLEGIREHLSNEVANGVEIPEDLMKKASNYLSTGIQACNAGNTDEGAKALAGLERLKGEFQRYITIPDEDSGVGFGQLDAKRLMMDSFDISDFEEGFDMEDLLSKLEERILSKMQNAIQVALDEQAKRFMTVIAQLDTKIAETVASQMAAVTDNITIGFKGDLKDKILESKEGIAQVTLGLDAALKEIEDDLPRATVAQLEAIFEDAQVRTYSSDAAPEVEKAIDAVVSSVTSSASEAEAREIIEEEAPRLAAELQAIYDADKEAQLAEGVLAFSDLHGMEDVWYTGWATAAKSAGVLNGATNPDGTKSAQPEKLTNVAEGITMLARQAAGGLENVPSEIDLSNSVVARMPDWAQSSATYLVREGVDLEGIVGVKQADESITRGEMMEAAAAAFNLSGDLSTAQAFSDSAGASTSVLAAAAGLVEAGVVNGETMPDGSQLLNLGGPLNKAAFAKIVVGVGAVAQASGQGLSDIQSYSGVTGGASIIDPTFSTGDASIGSGQGD